MRMQMRIKLAQFVEMAVAFDCSPKRVEWVFSDEPTECPIGVQAFQHASFDFCQVLDRTKSREVRSWNRELKKVVEVTTAVCLIENHEVWGREDAILAAKNAAS